MKNLILICLAVAACFALSCQNGKMEVRTKEVHDTIFTGDTIIVHDTVVVKDVRYYEGRWLKELFDSCEWKQYESYDYGFVISFPEFMVKDLNRTSEGSVFVEYKDIRLMAKAYKDNMSLEEKYAVQNKSANTKSMGENYFMIAGRIGNGCGYFEKDILMDGYWLYIRAEFPQPFAPYIDTLLQYVKNYGPSL
ncbi:MAG: hypothetical protein IKM76_10760 [Prevotella sp.]|nr:hypothetical protein [Prevotella sp.]